MVMDQSTSASGEKNCDCELEIQADWVTVSIPASGSEKSLCELPCPYF